MYQKTSERYDRQILISEIGESGQKKLLESSVLVVGAGGLGSPVLYYLAAAGVGKIHIVDCDVVSGSNLNRQILYGEIDLGKNKAPTAAEVIRTINSEIQVSSENVYVTDENAVEITRGYDAIVLCLDSIPARKTVNRAAVSLRIPYVEGAVSGFHGTLMTVVPGKTACYECAYPFAKQPKPPIPVLGAMVGIVGSMMALATIRLLLHLEDPSNGSLVFIDGNSYENSIEPLVRNPDCPVCKDK